VTLTAAQNEVKPFVANFLDLRTLNKSAPVGTATPFPGL